jgi:uncharacterized protein (TIGR02466 family)
MTSAANFLPVSPVYEFQAPEHLVDIALALKDNSDTEVIDLHIGSYFRVKDVDLNYSFYDSELYAWFNQCLKSVADIEYTEDIELVITECWIARLNKFQRVRKHNHMNSVLSGIFYLTDHDDISTNIYKENWFSRPNTSIRLSQKGREALKGSIHSKKGKLVLFPSHLIHDTDPNLSSDPRLTMVFNTFVSGNILNTTHFLSINTIGVEMAYKNKKGIL